MRYVRIDGSMVVEVGEFEGDVATMFHPSLVWIASDSAQIGDVWDGQVFSTPPPAAVDLAAFSDEVELRVQRRLDDFAATRGYSGIASLAGYAGDEDAVFNVEGTYGKRMRGQSWRAVINIRARVIAGDWPTAGAGLMPTSYADIEGELPELAWPNAEGQAT